MRSFGVLHELWEWIKGQVSFKQCTRPLTACKVKMKNMQVLAVLITLCLVTVNGHRFYTYTRTDTPCTPRVTRACGDHELLSDESTPLEESDGFGPNVCRRTKAYEVETFTHLQSNICFGQRCRTICEATKNCTGPLRNVTVTTTECCDGFAINPEDVTSPSSSFSRFFRKVHRSKQRILRESGCTLMLRESVTECLLELNLDAFTLLLVAESPDAADELGNGDSDGSYTIFGLSDEDVDVSASTLGHVVNRTVSGKKLTRGRVLPTLAENVLLHIGRAEEGVFVNGVEVTQLDACQARNGIVHIVKSPIPQPTMTITEILQQDPRFSTFLQLLDAANITAYLDVASGKSRTVLAPTNDAFDELPEGAVECLLLEENRNNLSQLVLIHISSPAEYSGTLSQRTRLYTFNRRYYLVVALENGEIVVTLDEIPLEESDIPANNGVIHALPQVILPREIDFDKCATTAEPPQVVGA